MMKFDAIEAERQRRLKTFKTLLLVSLGFLVVSIILFVIYYFNPNSVLMVIAFFVAVIFFILLTVAFSLPNNGFNKYCKDNLEKNIMNDVFQGEKYSYTEKNGVSFKEMNYSGLFLIPDDFETSDTIRTTYKGIELTLSDYIFTRIVTHTDSKGNTTHTRYPFPGRYMAFNLERNFESGVAIIDKRNNNMVFNYKLYKEPLDFESIDFNKRFYATTSNKEKAFYLIRPKEIMALLDLSNLYKGHISNVLVNHTIYFIIADTKVDFSFNIFHKLDEGIVKDIYGYYELPLKIIDSLNLAAERYNEKSLDE
ncbi:MAG: DUF3137 domain-containing protein [Bacilli bacterium]|jgi:hypothetical protein